MKKIKFVVLLTLALVLTKGCVPDSTIQNPEGFQGTIEDVTALYSEETVNAIKDLGLVINEGNTPPDVEGIWLATKSSMIATNVSDDVELGTQFADLQLSIANQDGAQLTLDFAGVEHNSSFKSQESFISGSGNDFTIYLKVVNDKADSSVRPITAYTFSGRVSGDAIVGLTWTLLMLDNKGNPEGIYIDNNDGRRFVDEDAVSTKMSDYGKGKFDGSLASIKSIFPGNAITKLQELGMEINTGNNPPNLGPNYTFDPILAATTRGTADDNLIFFDLFMTLKDQDNQELVIDFKADEDDSLLQGIRTFVSGNANKFTIYSKVFRYDPRTRYQFLALLVFSGAVSTTGEVDDFTYGFYMIDDRGDVSTLFIENDDARYFTNQQISSKKINPLGSVNSKGASAKKVVKLMKGSESIKKLP